MSIGIYQIVCVPSGKRYVGSSIQIRVRRYQHRSDLRGGYHCNPHLQNAWNKYGEGAFTFTILEECTCDELIAREQHYIDTLHPEFNVNLIVDAPPMRGKTMSAEHKAKISAANTGRVMSEETKSKLRKSALGRKHTPETRAKMSASKLGRAQSESHRSAITTAHRSRSANMSDEDRRQIGLKNVGKKRTPEQRARISASIKLWWKNRKAL